MRVWLLLTERVTILTEGKQIINNAKEMIIPMLKAWWHRKKVDNYISLHYLMFCSEG